MQVADVQEVLERQPFRPFTLRLTNGASYRVAAPRNIGSSVNFSMLFYFGEAGGGVRIDRDRVVEIIEEE